MNRGDTVYLMLNYTINGDPLVQNAYQEIELSIKGQHASVRKTLSEGTIEWGTVTYDNDGVEESFTGYITHLDQKDTFKLDEGSTSIQLRIMVNDEVGSSEISDVVFGQVLSNKVLVANDSN